MSTNLPTIIYQYSMRTKVAWLLRTIICCVTSQHNIPWQHNNHPSKVQRWLTDQSSCSYEERSSSHDAVKTNTKGDDL